MKRENFFLFWKKNASCPYWIQNEVIGVLKRFLAFASSFQPRYAHNMMVFMFDPRFIRDYVGLELAMQVVTMIKRFECHFCSLFIMP